FTLTFASLEEMEEYTSYAAMLGVPVTVLQVYREDGLVRAVFLKHKRSGDELKKILRTGLSPLD
ncbi:MAG: RNA ligase, partial [Desulfurococcales archaeon]|nr:RNA ligase [Desulfurococcales archaeon]